MTGLELSIVASVSTECGCVVSDEAQLGFDSPGESCDERAEKVLSVVNKLVASLLEKVLLSGMATKRGVILEFELSERATPEGQRLAVGQRTDLMLLRSSRIPQVQIIKDVLRTLEIKLKSQIEAREIGGAVFL